MFWHAQQAEGKIQRKDVKKKEKFLLGFCQLRSDVLSARWREKNRWTDEFSDP